MKKRRFIRSTSVLLMAAALSVQPLTTFANEYTGEIGTGDDAILEADGATGSNTNGNSNTDNTTSGGTSGNTSSGSVNDTYKSQNQTNAENAQHAAGNLLQQWIDRVQGSDNYQTWGITSGSNLLNTMGLVQIPDTEVGQLLENISQFQSAIEQEPWLNNALNVYDSVDNNEHTEKSLSDDGSWDKLSEEEKEAVKKAIAEKEGLEYRNGLVGTTIPKDGTGGNKISMKYGDKLTPPFAIHNSIPMNGFSYTEYPGIRNDLILGGLNDANSWTGRFQSLYRMESNAMEDYLVVSYIQDYHISSVVKNDIQVIDYTSNVRRWVITNADTGERIGEPMITDNPKHQVTVNFKTPGNYKVIAEQEARYHKGMSIKYDIHDYLFDAETKNLLFFNHKTVGDGKGGSIYLGGEEQTGFLPTGDSFLLKVNDLGQAEVDGSATERME